MTKKKGVAGLFSLLPGSCCIFCDFYADPYKSMYSVCLFINGADIQQKKHLKAFSE